MKIENKKIKSFNMKIHGRSTKQIILFVAVLLNKIKYLENTPNSNIEEFLTTDRTSFSHYIAIKNYNYKEDWNI